MQQQRKPCQGLRNIIRFNWHFYVIAGVVLSMFFWINLYLPLAWQWWVMLLGLATLGSLVSSLLVSWYVYDYSNLYKLLWLPNCNHKQLLNIHAGFDEISSILQQRHPDCQLFIADFYNPQKHTELSIKRARKAYPPQPRTIGVDTSQLPFDTHSFDYILAFLAAHEIRNATERVEFFQELHRILKPHGQLIITEHLRNFPNFLAYTVGFFHFQTKGTWFKTFSQAYFRVKQVHYTTPFVYTFILEKNGHTS